MEKSARYKGERKYASKVLDGVLSEMTGQQIDEGDRIVEQWSPTPKDCDPRRWW